MLNTPTLKSDGLKNSILSTAIEYSTISLQRSGIIAICNAMQGSTVLTRYLFVFEGQKAVLSLVSLIQLQANRVKLSTLCSDTNHLSYIVKMTIRRNI